MSTVADEQLSADAFIGEVIGIGYLRKLQVNLPPYESRRRGSVTVNVTLEDPANALRKSNFTAEAKTTGLALRDIREQVREHFGR